jgi:hypothetical protein
MRTLPQSVAVGGAVLLALGTLFQHKAVEDQGPAPGRAAGSMGGGRLQALLRKPVWLTGTAMLGAAILLQLPSLRFSPLIVVQPIGAVALVVTTLATARMTRSSPGRRRADFRGPVHRRRGRVRCRRCCLQTRR